MSLQAKLLRNSATVIWKIGFSCRKNSAFSNMRFPVPANFLSSNHLAKDRFGGSDAAAQPNQLATSLEIL
jgi:hypothetical protein